MINSIFLFQEFEFEKAILPFQNPVVPKVPARECHLAITITYIETKHGIKPIKAYF
jgi:hypothetical protein